jgi:hypothetical protein
MPSDLIRGCVPVHVKKTRQNKKLEPPFDSIGTEKALAQRAIKQRKADDHGKRDHRVADRAEQLVTGASEE